MKGGSPFAKKYTAIPPTWVQRTPEQRDPGPFAPLGRRHLERTLRRAKEAGLAKRC